MDSQEAKKSDYIDGEFIADLEEAYRKRKLVFFIGAGISMSQGYSSWSKYVDDLIEYWKFGLGRIGNQEIDFKVVRQLDWLKSNSEISLMRKIDIVQMMIENVCEQFQKDTKEHLLEFEKQWFIEGKPTSLQNEILDRLMDLSPTFLTTNYDEEIERSWDRNLLKTGLGTREENKAIAKTSFNYERVTSLEKFEMSNGNLEQKYILHVHGTPSTEFEIVNSSKSYGNLYYIDNHATFTRLNNFLDDKVLVFLGSSLQEDELLQNLHPRKAYALMKADSNQIGNELLGEYYGRKKDIKIIWYGQQFNELSPFVAKMVSKITNYHPRNLEREKAIVPWS